MSLSKAGQTATPAMILPIPAGPVEMVDLSAFADIFVELNKAFPKPPARRSKGRSRGGDRSLMLDSFLEVQAVGSYSVSVAPSLEDLQRIDPSVFTVSPGIGALGADAGAMGQFI